MEFYAAESFLFNFGAACENFGLRIVKQFKKGLKKFKGSQKKVTKTTVQTPSHSKLEKL